MKRPNNHVFVAFLAILIVLAPSCTKFRENRQYDTTFDHSLAESSYFDLFKTLQQVAGAGAGLVSDPCYTVSSSGSTYPKTITVDFGSSDCAGLYGIYRRGTVTIVLSDELSNSGATATITPNNLYINGSGLQGGLLVTNLGLNTDGKQEYSFATSDAHLNYPGGEQTFTWTASYVLTLDRPFDANLVYDDVYTITGNTSGVNTDGNDYSVDIKEPLVKELICRWPRAGKISITVKDLKDREVDFGTDYCEDNVDCCDNQADVTIGNKSAQTVSLK